MILLSAKNVTISYENRLAVDRVSFNVLSGDYICIVGENGSGKSTLIKGILGLSKLKSGEIEYKGGTRQREIGYLPQNTMQKDFPASVFEVVLSGCLNRRRFYPFYTEKDKIRALNNLNKLAIDDIKNKSYKDLSGGEQRRVLLARALCATEKIIILDEPVAGLDPLISAEFYALIKRLNKENGITIIMVSHDIKEAVKNANKILHMNKKMLFFGDTFDYAGSNIGKGFMGGSYASDYK